jgi:hypothetical protein
VPSTKKARDLQVPKYINSYRCATCRFEAAD